jgi:transposase
MANANQVILTVTEAMKLGATTRSLPLAAYIAQLCDSDAASIRALRIETPLNSAFRPNLSRESSDDDDEWSPRECPQDKREKILSMLAEGIPPIGVAQRLSVSAVTIYRIRAQARKKQSQSRPQRRLAQASAIAELSDDELCTEYRNGVPIATLAARFKLAPCAVSAELRRRGVCIRRTGPRLGKLGWTPRKAAKT